MSGKCFNFIFCADPRCSKVHYLSMNFRERLKSKEACYGSKSKITTERVPVDAKVIRCPKHVVCASPHCKLYHSGIGIATRLQWRELIFRECLESEFEPSPPSHPSSHTPTPKRRFVKKPSTRKRVAISPSDAIFTIPECAEVWLG